MIIRDVAPGPGYHLVITAEDGRSGVLDIAPYLHSEAFQALRERDQFLRVHNGRYFIEWDCGADLSADTIEARWRLGGAVGAAQQAAAADGRQGREGVVRGTRG
jgi:hypothetical protein